MKRKKGFLLVGVLFAFLFLMIVVPVMVKWVQNDTRLAVKDQKSSMAFSLAEAAVDRGYWKIKGSTSTFNQASIGGTILGYNFDAVYTDISGGKYRIKISSGPGEDQITILGEGRDLQNKETRSIKAVYLNTTVPGAILSGGNLSADSASVVHWGPIMARGNMSFTGTIPDYPRKLARGTVFGRDPTGDTNPPNNDSNGDWQSAYNVPELPVFDFETLRSSAAATHTQDCQNVRTVTYTPYDIWTPNPLNCTYVQSHVTKTVANSCTSSHSFKKGSNSCTSGTSGTCSVTSTALSTSTSYGPMQCCDDSGVYGGPVTCAYGTAPCENCIVNDLYDSPYRDKDYTWYWSHNVTWQGYTGTRGTIIVRDSMVISSYPTTDYDDRYCRGGTGASPGSTKCTVNVPPKAYLEYSKIDTSAGTADPDYPGDKGLRSNVATYAIGTMSGAMDASGSGGDLGIYGFLYVGGSLARYGAADIYGAAWVVGNISGEGNTMIFFNSKLKVPTLNVMLEKESWLETKPSTAAWP